MPEPGMGSRNTYTSDSGPGHEGSSGRGLDGPLGGRPQSSIYKALVTGAEGFRITGNAFLDRRINGIIQQYGGWNLNIPRQRGGVLQDRVGGVGRGMWRGGNNPNIRTDPNFSINPHQRPRGNQSIPMSTRPKTTKVWKTSGQMQQSFKAGLKNLNAGKKFNAKQVLMVGNAYLNAISTPQGRANATKALFGGATSARNATPAQKAMAKRLQNAARTAALVAKGNVQVYKAAGGQLKFATTKNLKVKAAVAQIKTLTPRQKSLLLARAMTNVQAGKKLTTAQMVRLKGSNAKQRKAARR